MMCLIYVIRHNEKWDSDWLVDWLVSEKLENRANVRSSRKTMQLWESVFYYTNIDLLVQLKD